MKTARRGKLTVYVYSRGSPQEASPIDTVFRSIPVGVQPFYRIEHLHVGSGQGEWQSAIFRNRIYAESRVLRFDGSVNRKPILNCEPDTGDVSGPFRVVDYLDEEEHMAEVITVRLLDGKTTDNKGWNRTERADGKVYFSKSIDGKVYVLDRWAAMGARIEGSLMNTPGYVAPGGKKSPSKDSFVSTLPRVKAKVHHAAPTKSAPKKSTPKHETQADVLSRKARELMTGRKGR